MLAGAGPAAGLAAQELHSMWRILHRRNDRFGRSAVSRVGIPHPETVGPSHALYGVDFQRRNKMLGLGLVGTIIVVVLVVWIIRRV
jgi:hypothetical protein